MTPSDSPGLKIGGVGANRAQLFFKGAKSYKSPLAPEWQQLWNQCTSNKLYSAQPVVGRSVSSLLGRYDSVLINCLRIGHTRLTNSYLLKVESQPVCESCHSPLTVKHILVDCARYSA